MAKVYIYLSPIVLRGIMGIVETIEDLFVNRTDTYSTQNSDGSYKREDESLLPEYIGEHLDGKRTIGVYQFSKEEKVKWVCFDYDGPDLEVEKKKAISLYNHIRSIGVESVLLEFSGKKGYHIWVFCQPIDGYSAKYWADEVAKESTPHEVFPKQEKIEGKFGNLVKLPLGIHKVSGKRSVIFDDTINEIPNDRTWKYMEELSSRNRFTIPKVVVKEVVRTIYQRQGKGSIPPYIDDLINKGVDDGDRHVKRFIVTKELYNEGFGPDEIMNNVNTFNQNCSPPEDHNVVEGHVRTLLQYPERYLAKEITESVITPEDLEKYKDIDYHTVIQTFKKWLYIEDDSIIDLCLAISLWRTKDPPLWLIVVAPSGSGKTEILKAFEDKSDNPSTEIMSKITPNTFLSGVSQKKEQHTDFAERISGFPKLFLTYDVAQFLKMDPKDKSQVWAQMRDIYDGCIERKAFNVSKYVKDIKINWLICSTNAIDAELLIHNELGTREMIYRFNSKNVDQRAVLKRILKNIGKEKLMRDELNYVVRKFIEKQETEGLREIEIPENVEKEIMTLAEMISYLRASAAADNYTGELENFVYTEVPTRIFKQLLGLYSAMKNLSNNYSDEKAIKNLQKIALSSILPLRGEIIYQLIDNKELSTTGLYKNLGVGKKSVTTQLETARQLGLVDFREQEEEVSQWKKWNRKYWYVVEESPVIQYLRRNKGFQDTLRSLYSGNKFEYDKN